MPDQIELSKTSSKSLSQVRDVAEAVSALEGGQATTAAGVLPQPGLAAPLSPS